MGKVKDKIERYKVLAEILCKENSKVYIKDIQDNIYFGFIVLVGEDRLTIDCFAPLQRSGERKYLYWAEIMILDKYEERTK